MHFWCPAVGFHPYTLEMLFHHEPYRFMNLMNLHDEVTRIQNLLVSSIGKFGLVELTLQLMISWKYRAENPNIFFMKINVLGIIWYRITIMNPVQSQSGQYRHSAEQSEREWAWPLKREVPSPDIRIIMPNFIFSPTLTGSFSELRKS